MLTMLLTGQVSGPAFARSVMDGARRHVPEQTTFHGVHTFRLVRSRNGALQSERRPFRYRWRPAGARVGPTSDGSMRFVLELVLGDMAWSRVDDPTWRWPAYAPTVAAGTLVLDEPMEREPPGLAFNPLVLAPGLEPGGDDLLSDRAGAYAVAHVARVRQQRNRPKP
jgi:hypothetical protein